MRPFGGEQRLPYWQNEWIQSDGLVSKPLLMCEYAMRRSHNWLRKKGGWGILIKAFSQLRKQVNQKEGGGIVKKGKKKLALHALGHEGTPIECIFSAWQMEKAPARKQQKIRGERGIYTGQKKRKRRKTRIITCLPMKEEKNTFICLLSLRTQSRGWFVSSTGFRITRFHEYLFLTPPNEWDALELSIHVVLQTSVRMNVAPYWPKSKHRHKDGMRWMI